MALICDHLVLPTSAEPDRDHSAPEIRDSSREITACRKPICAQPLLSRAEFGSPCHRCGAAASRRARQPGRTPSPARTAAQTAVPALASRYASAGSWTDRHLRGRPPPQCSTSPHQAAPLRGAVPGRASRRACGTYGADPARRTGQQALKPPGLGPAHSMMHSESRPVSSKILPYLAARRAQDYSTIRRQAVPRPHNGVHSPSYRENLPLARSIIRRSGLLPTRSPRYSDTPRSVTATDNGPADEPHSVAAAASADAGGVGDDRCHTRAVRAN